MDIQQQAEGPKGSTIVKLWRRNHQIFKGKFSSGATPKTCKDTVKLNHTQKKTKITFTNDNTTPRRRLNICSIIKQNLVDPLHHRPAIIKKISNIEQVEEEHTSVEKKEVYTTPPKKPSAATADHDRSIKDSYENVKYRLKEYDNEDSRFENDYEELSNLGSGCFGVVKKCRNKVDGNIYAIKIMKPFQKNLNEVKALATLSNIECANIVRYHNSWIENSRLFMVMEYCEKSLKKTIDEYRKKCIIFTQTEIKSIALDILHALESLHRNNIVHLDIKPQNILLSMNGKYKLGDLGLCRIAHVSHREDVTEGDSKYLAKEILSTLDETELPDLTKADIFSLGMTLYELVTMQELPNTGELWHQLRQGYIQANLNNYEQQYSPKLLQIIANMTDPSFSNRTGAEQILHRPYFYSFERATALIDIESKPVTGIRRLSF